MESGCSSQLNMMRMVVKMAASPSIAVLLLCCCCSVASADAPCDLYAETNKDFTVPLTIILPNAGLLQWKHGDKTVIRLRYDNGFKGNDNTSSNGSLMLKKVSKANAGIYTPEVFASNGKAVGEKKSKTLCVMDTVPTPTVKFDCTKSKSSVKVTCTVSQTKDLTFTWVQDGKVLKDKKGQTLEMKKDQVLETSTFSCNVSNKVSSLGSETKKQTCIKSSLSFPPDIFGINTWYFVGGGGGVLLLLIILVVICCIRMRRKKTMQVKDEEELRLGWTNPNQQHQQHHHHHHGPAPNQHHHHHQQQQPAGHTGPRQHRSKQPRSQQRPSRDPAQPNGQPQPSPRRAAQVPRPADTTDDEKPPPLPQPRKKAPKTPRV